MSKTKARMTWATDLPPYRVCVAHTQGGLMVSSLQGKPRWSKCLSAHFPLPSVEVPLLQRLAASLALCP